MGEEKMNKEFDIHHIINSVRKVNLLMSLLLDKHQTALTKYLPDSLLTLEKVKALEAIKDPNDSLSQGVLKNDLDSMLEDEDFRVDDSITQKLLLKIIPKVSLHSETISDSQVIYYPKAAD